MRLIENWFSERYSDNLQLSFRVQDQLLSVKTDYQRIDLFNTYDFGKLLSIDGTVQLTEKDEYIYHEMITMVPYYCTAKSDSALIIGGGDGGAAKRLIDLGIKRIVNVEIDQNVVEISRKYFPELADSFNNKNVELIIGDGIKYVKDTDESFDLIIIDSTDPVGPAEGLFNKSFYENARARLSDDGIIVTQSGSPYYQPEALKMATKGMLDVFSNVRTYIAFIPTYPSGLWSFTMASKSEIMQRKEKVIPGRYFNEDVLKGSFYLPEFVKNIIKSI
ncbi:polyamine aminopropyltransferase [Picrophilus oshimae]|uniref:Polyamine aminopropyltransferase n=1 Tax=Picrophilus torridus (strain ATCC 700027 / DSM 9790 / JCM 10055 / NBRC 100828 / KAW 2/3) TaxID=1122961 RepID=A0A8G2FW00_PICTO|nr:polyamine aminopropyltransferase [Picrophilus oshimae]SMD30496.1 spermidine synthase /spermine synthase [Picrophilus oshimae DSM 9789]